MSFQSSRELLAAMAARLKPLLPEIAFVGGCTTGLLITDPAASPARVTDDVDVIVEVASYAEYSRLSKRLRNLGFAEDSSEGAPICRWLIAIGREVGKLLDNPEFVNALPGHLASDEIGQARVPMVLRTLNSLCALGPKRSAPRQKRKRP